MRTIFDRLGVSDAQRTYALSYYAHTKCSFVTFGSCRDEDQFAWAAQTLRVSRSRVGSAARMTLIEWGTNRTDHAIPHTVEHLGVLMQQLGIEGGNYYKWSDAPANDPQWAYNPQALVKVRGPGYIYQPVQRELADLYGFHLTAIANGSFEDGTNGWTVAGQGKAQPTALDETAVPWRGKTFLRLTATDSASITGAPIQVSPSTAYTTTANLRFAWTGEPKVKPKPKSKSKAKAKPKPVQRPQVDVIFRYLTCAHRPSAVRRQDISAYFRQNSTNGFQTFPFKHTTPKDTCFVQIQFVAARNHLPTPITLDIDNIR